MKEEMIYTDLLPETSHLDINLPTLDYPYVINKKYITVEVLEHLTACIGNQ